MNFGLSLSVIKKIRSVLACHPEVQSAIIYGSRARGDFREGSDIDLTLLGGSDLGHQVLSRIIDELDELLLPYSFDLSLYKDITDTSVQDHIARVGQEFYHREQVSV